MPIRPTSAASQTLESRRTNDCCGSRIGTALHEAAVSRAWSACLVLAVLVCGCTTPSEYVHNGFKVGPNYCPPGAPVADNWIDATDKRVRTESDDLSQLVASLQRSGARRT